MKWKFLMMLALGLSIGSLSLAACGGGDDDDDAAGDDVVADDDDDVAPGVDDDDDLTPSDDDVTPTDDDDVTPTDDDDVTPTDDDDDDDITPPDDDDDDITPPDDDDDDMACDPECGDGETCQDGECVSGDCEDAIPCFDYPQCLDTADCDPGEFCDFDNKVTDECANDCGTCTPICQTDADCEDGYICNKVTGKCQLPACSRDSECGGDCCVIAENGLASCEACPDNGIDSCTITSANRVIAAGGSFKANAIGKKGDKAVARVAFDWKSSDEGIATVGADGTVSAVAEGTAMISASSGGTDCGAIKVDVIAAPAAGKAIYLLDAGSGDAVSGADVRVGAEKCAAGGAGVYTCTASDGDIHAFADGYNYVSFVGGTPAAAVLIHLIPKAQDPGKIHGQFEFTDEPQDLALGIAGMSIAGSLLDLDFNMLLGESETVHLTCEGLIDDDVDLPGGLVFAAQGLCTGSKDAYNAQGVPGHRAAWGIGGRLPLDVVVENVAQFADLFSGGTDNLPIGQILTVVLPLFATFEHALDAGIELESGQTQNVDMTLDASLSLFTTLKIPGLPELAGEHTDMALVLAGITDPDLGLVPLGIGAGVDDPDDTGVKDGVVSPSADQPGLSEGEIGINMAPAHGGLEERNGYAYALISLSLTNLSGGTSLSGLVKRTESVEKNIDFSSQSFPPFLEGSSFDPGTGTGSFSGDDSAATLIRMDLHGADGEWAVYAPKGTKSFTVPTDTPADHSSDATNVNADLLQVSGGATAADLIDASSAVGLNDLNAILDGFSVWQTPEPAQP